jgi:CBS domain-containing protein
VIDYFQISAVGLHRPTECVLAHEVHSTARAVWLGEYTVDFQLSLENEGVGSAYPDQPLAAAANDSIGQVLQLLRAQRTGAVLVCEGPKLVGILTERDALKLMARGADMTTTVREEMSKEPATISTGATVGEAIRVMAEGGYRHLPIVDEAGRPSGVVAVHGIVHYLVDHFPETVYNLPPDPKNSTREREGA